MAGPTKPLDDMGPDHADAAGDGSVPSPTLVHSATVPLGDGAEDAGRLSDVSDLQPWCGLLRGASLYHPRRVDSRTCVRGKGDGEALGWGLAPARGPPLPQCPGFKRAERLCASPNPSAALALCPAREEKNAIVGK